MLITETKSSHAIGQQGTCQTVTPRQPWRHEERKISKKKRSVAFYCLDCLITADYYGLFRFRLLVHKAYCYFSSELVFLVAFILYFRGTKTRESRLFRPFSLYFKIYRPFSGQKTGNYKDWLPRRLKQTCPMF